MWLLMSVAASAETSAWTASAASKYSPPHTITTSRISKAEHMASGTSKLRARLRLSCSTVARSRTTRCVRFTTQARAPRVVPVLRRPCQNRRFARHRMILGFELWLEGGLHPVTSIARMPRRCSISGFSAARPRYSRDFTVESGARVTLAISSSDISSWKRSIRTSR